MEYERPPTAPLFSSQLRNRSHSLSFSGNVVYDGVFSSPAKKEPPPAIDYGEIFRVSGPSSSSSIPFLDVPELYEEKIKVDVRSSKLDYSSVFGGFKGCDFTVSPEELIIKSERKSPAEEDKRYHKKAGNGSDVPPSSKVKNQISSPEVVSMKQFNVSYHQTAPRNENGINWKAQVAQVDSVSGYTQFVDNPSPLPEMESRTPMSSFEKEPCNGGPVKVADCDKVQVEIPSCNGSRKRSSKNEADFDNIFGRNGSKIGDNISSSECKTDSNTKHPGVSPPSSLKRSVHGEKEGSERTMGAKSESFRSEGADSPCSPTYFDEETDANSVAAASSAALKKAIEEAQRRINIAKQMMERKKAGFRNRSKQRTSESLKFEDKGNRKFERQKDTCRGNETKIVGEVVSSSKQSFLLEGERVLGDLVNYSKQSSPSMGKRNIGEVVNSSEQSVPDKGEQNVGEVVNSSVQSFPNKVDHNVGEVVNSSKQSFPDAGKRNAGEEVNTPEQLFPDKGEHNVGEVVNSSEGSIRNGEKQSVCEVASSSEQPLPIKGEQNFGEVINSPEQSVMIAGEHDVGESVYTLEKSFPIKVEQSVGEVVESFEEPFANKGERNLGEENSSEQTIPNEEEHSVGEALSSFKQSFMDPGEQQVKRARRLWEVPGGIFKSIVQEEARKHEVTKEEEEHARKARKHWEMPGGIFNSIVNGKQHETENLAATEYATDANVGMPKAPENSFYSFGQLGNKIRCVVEAFTGSKIAQTSEAEGTKHVIIDSFEHSNITREVIDQENQKKVVSEEEEKFVGCSGTAISEREVEEILKPTESQSPTQIDENAESTMCELKEECSQQKEEETEWYKHSENISEFRAAPLAGVHDTHENSNVVYDESEEESLPEPQEVLVGPVDTKTYEMEVEENPKYSQSMHETQIDENAGCMVSVLAENASVSGNAAEGKEKEVHKTPRRRRVWKTSEDVYDMIKGLKRYNRAWQLEDDEKEMMKRCLREQSERVNAIGDEESESISEVPTDSGLQENWNVLKQMFREMIQTADTKREDETGCLEDSEQNHFEIPQRAEGVDRKGAAETSNYELTGSDSVHDTCERDTMETMRTGFEGYLHTKENEDSVLTLKKYCNVEEVEVEEQNKSSELIGEEVETIEMVNNQEAEDIPEVSQAADTDQAAFILSEITTQAGSCAADILDHDQSNSDEKFEQNPCEELSEETKIGGNLDDDSRGPLFESGQGDSDIEVVDIEQEVYDQCPEKTSSTSSTAECVEEVDSESNKSVWDVEDMEFIGKRNENDDTLKSFLEESLAGYALDAGTSRSSCKPEESVETKLKLHDNEGKPDSEYPEEFSSRSSTEAAESLSSSSKEEEENLAAADRNTEDNDREGCSRSSVNEERDATTEASRNGVKLVEERSKKIDKAKEKEREREKERIMVERAIREARERAFAEAKERAGIAAMEKANAGTHRRTASEVRGRSGKAFVEASDKLSSAEKASMQAKLRAERAAVERVLAEARERALEKALSGKARSQAGKSFVSSGERRGFSSSSTENRSSAPPSSSNQSGNREPAERCKARSERCQRTAERAAKALAEKKLRDLIAQKEQAERNRLAETLDAEVKRWSSGKEGNLRALLSTLQYILGPDSGWKPIHLTDLVSSAAVRKGYRKATLYVHPDKLQQRGAATQQKYICEKVFDLLKEAWNKFSAEER